MTALVFNCHYNGLSMIQELGRHGVKVLALDSSRSIGTFSRYARYYRCPNPQTDEDLFIDFLLKLGATFNEKPVLFSTNDNWALAISRHKERLLHYYIPCVADYPTVELVTQKQLFHEWAVSSGVPVPRSWQYTQSDMIPDDAFPIVAKPLCRRFASNHLSADYHARMLDKMRFTVLKNRDDLNEFSYKHKDILSDFLFQEYIDGLSDCMYTIGVYVSREHEIKGLFAGRKVRGFPPDSGDCVVGQVEEVPEYLKELVKRVCRDIKYQGIAEFEFKRDARTGEFKLIEINPRSWSWIGITPACGVSLPWLAYCDLTGESIASYAESDLPTGSVKWVKVFEDLPNCLYKNRRSGYEQWHMTLRNWRRSLDAKRLVIADLAMDDPLPTLYSIYSLTKNCFRSLLKCQAE